MHRRILLVEHDRRAALALADTIRRAGDQLVGRATRLDDALRKVSALAAELVLVDVAIASDAVEALRARCRVPVLWLADRTSHDPSSILGPHVPLDVGAPELAVMIELLCRGAYDAMPCA
jgi:DNA-binding response OmpR family regulator